MKTNKLGFGMLLFLLLAMPFATAQETVDESVVIEGGSQYAFMSRAMDRVRLAFTLNAEKKLEVMNKIQEKREAHYNFLAANGKTEQASKFRQRTEAMSSKFEQQREQIRQRLETKTQNMEQIQQRVEQRTASQGEAAQAEAQVRAETAQNEEAGRARS